MELANRFPEGKTRNEVGYFEIQPLCEELPTAVMLGVFETQSIVTELVNNVSEVRETIYIRNSISNPLLWISSQLNAVERVCCPKSPKLEYGRYLPIILLDVGELRHLKRH
ncbi:hypothetical protein GX48_00857 [Paracoccidioides brasiliensis]|nr:hypothetical protein GX48_00857 [Paracoccidioides brasiliensis]